MNRTIFKLLPLPLFFVVAGGCSSLGTYLTTGINDRRYHGTGEDLSFVGHSLSRGFDDCHSVGLHAGGTLMALIDLPFSFVADTLLFPFEQYNISRERYEKSLVNRKLKTWPNDIANNTFNDADIAKSFDSIPAWRLAHLFDSHRQDDLPPELLKALFLYALTRDDAFLTLNICAQKQFPASLAQTLYNNRDLLNSSYWNDFLILLINNPNTPESCLLDIVKNASSLKTFVALAKCPRLTPDAVNTVFTNTFPAPPVLRFLTAANPDTSPDVLHSLFTSSGDDYRIRIALASNPNVPLDLLPELATSSNTSVRVALAKNTALPDESFTFFDYECNSDVHNALAQNPRTPPMTLCRIYIASRDCSHLSKYILAHPNTPDDLVQKIADDTSVDYRQRDKAKKILKQCARHAQQK